MARDSPHPFVELQPDSVTPLPATDAFPEAAHRWSAPEIDALIFAVAARRPLLVRGEAGCGKSQVARAAARELGHEDPLCETVHPRFEALDLLYRQDLVHRLADAQERNLDRSGVRYVQHGVLWRALEAIEPGKPLPVVLIDEIDKADAEVPNALLDVLGNRSFQVAPLGGKVVSSTDRRLPITVITTNEERELPPAFVRRCVVLNLSPPDDREGSVFVEWLLERGEVHEHLNVDRDAARAAAEQVLADRRATRAAGYRPVGLAEYVDLLTALHELTEPVPEDLGELTEDEWRREAQLSWLDRIAVYGLVKNAGQDQRRPTVRAQSGDDGE